MKTIFLAFLVVVPLAATTGRAQQLSQEGQLRFFATCAGRLSAQMEFQWITDGPASEITKRQRAAVLAILDSIVPVARRGEILSWRIKAKQAQAVLLDQGTFNSDARAARIAQRLATRRIGECRSVLLS